MRHVIFGLGLFLMAGVAQADVYRPVAGDCRALAQAYGPANVYVGAFSGAVERFWGGHRRFYRSGCFRTLRECREWIGRIGFYAEPSPWETKGCARGLRSRIR